MVLLAIGVFGGSVWYLQLSDRHKAIVKTRLFHTFRIMDHKWEVKDSEVAMILDSPELLVDDIYQSMDGPQALINLNMNPDGEDIRWITGFKTEVIKTGTNSHNNDFLCHTNIDFSDAIHYKNLKIPRRVKKQYPRLGTLSNGINELQFPKGFGFPVAADESFIVASRTLNHNIDDAFFKVKHQIEFQMEKGSALLKPLRPMALVLLQNYDRINPDAPDLEKDPNLCLPLDLKNHSFRGNDGLPWAAHWVLPEGKHRYEYNVTYQMFLPEDTTIHAMAAHLHPHAESLILYDITADEEVYLFDCKNYPDKKGLKKVPVYSSETGLPLIKGHEYKLILETENTTIGFSDMMAVLFLYVYDREMDEHLSKLQL